MTIDELKDTNDALAEARARNPDWGIWISSAGRYWATRRGKVEITEHATPGWAMTIDADSLVELKQEIRRQEALSCPHGLAPHSSLPGEEYALK